MAVLAIAGAWACVEESPEGRFPCGSRGGSCDVETELCVVGDGCSTCIPRPGECEVSDECGCLDGVDKTAWEAPCADAGTCEARGDGLVVTCMALEWGCG